MSDIIKRFSQDLQLAGYAERSSQAYVQAVLKLQRFHNKPLEDISDEDLRQYWLSCKTEYGWSAATLRISLLSAHLVINIRYFKSIHKATLPK